VLSLPNLISLGRLFSAPVALYLIITGGLDAAFWVVLAAALSDGADGIIARTCRARTVLGGYLDPLADKALLLAAYPALGHAGLVPPGLVILVVFRDMIIVGGFLLLRFLKETLAMQPSATSKLTTAAQMTLAAAVLAPGGLAGSPAGPAPLEPPPLEILVWAVAAVTLLSGAGYVVQGCRLLSRWGAAR
jgi:cardiolipin synthase